MKTGAIALVALFSATAMPSTAAAHGIGWWGPGIFFGGLALGTALAYPYYGYPGPYAYPYPYAYSAPPVYDAPPVPLVQRDICYANGCYHLYGDGVTQAWQWVWTPATAPPAASPSP